MRNESAVSSVDFLVGFTIFLLAFILVVDMVPGVLIGIDSNTVDYDAVAYRTGTILVEDPGWPVFPAWEQYDSSHKNEIQRMGLAVTKESPCVLSYPKITKFFETSFFTPQDYREKVIFGEIPYSYNISLKIEDGKTFYTGESVPEHSYGYMRRLVKVKTNSSASIDCRDYLKSTAENMTRISALISYEDLQDPGTPEIYRIDPRTDRITVSINNFSESLNLTDITDIRLKKWDAGRGDYVDISDLVEDDAYELSDNGTRHYIDESWNVSTTSRVTMLLDPPLPFSEQPDTWLLLEFSISGDRVGNYTGKQYRYGDFDGFTPAQLTDGVLEVAVW